MDYEKAYNKALERAKYYYTKGYFMINSPLEKIFPELQESEDEKIRKELIDAINGLWVNDALPLPLSVGRKDKWIAWLEKQGKQKPILDFKASNWYVSEVDGKIHDMTYNPADKDEPKFKVGDWIITKDKNVHKDYSICKIVEIENNRYHLENGDYLDIDTLEQYDYRLWTIKDAKDGDVLACGDKVTDCPFIFHNLTEEQNPRSYCGINTSGDFQYNDENGGFWCKSDEVRPATKEQRDLLFQKMKEDGYEWDAEKKELKKIHVIDEGKAEMDYCFTKMIAGEKANPTWNVEDSSKVQRICQYLNEAKKYYADITEVRECVEWLKSIEDRVQPKPVEWSEEDERIITALKEGFKYHQLFNPTFGGILITKIIDWLTSLKERLS